MVLSNKWADTDRSGSVVTHLFLEIISQVCNVLAVELRRGSSDAEQAYKQAGKGKEARHWS